MTKTERDSSSDRDSKKIRTDETLEIHHIDPGTCGDCTLIIIKNNKKKN